MQLADVMRVPTYNTYSLYPDEDGKYYNNEITTGGNYLARLRHGGLTTNDKDHFQGIVSGDLKIWQGLKLRGVVGYDIISEHRLIKRRYYPVYKYLNKDQIANAGQSKNYSIQDYNNKATMLNLQFFLDYNHTYNDVHQVTGLFGFTSESFRSEKMKSDVILSIQTFIRIQMIQFMKLQVTILRMVSVNVLCIHGWED